MPFPDHIPIRTLAVEPGSSWQKRWALLRRTLIEHSPCIYIPNYDWYHSGICSTLPATVKVIGTAHSDDPAHYAHCLKLGSTWNGILAVSFEGLPVSLLEAMAHGTVPVVAHCRSGVDEVIHQGKNGFLVTVGDIEGFVNYIIHLSENPQQMAQAARQTIETGGFTINAMTESYLHLMEQIVSQPFSRPVTGILPPEDIRGWRSWLPPELPSPTVAVQSLRKRVELILTGLRSYF